MGSIEMREKRGTATSVHIFIQLTQTIYINK